MRGLLKLQWEAEQEASEQIKLLSQFRAHSPFGSARSYLFLSRKFMKWYFAEFRDEPKFLVSSITSSDMT